MHAGESNRMGPSRSVTVFDTWLPTVVSDSASTAKLPLYKVCRANFDLRPLDAHNAAGDGGSARNRCPFFSITIDGLVAIQITSFHFAPLNFGEKNEPQIHALTTHYRPRHLDEPHQRDNSFCGYQAIIEGRSLVLACPQAPIGTRVSHLVNSSGKTARFLRQRSINPSFSALVFADETARPRSHPERRTGTANQTAGSARRGGFLRAMSSCVPPCILVCSTLRGNCDSESTLQACEQKP